ncbi:hypothetical protein MUK42_30145 [Musa troglodytarum]|nr:hypothetical protein MUK42_30145 [Musa troglodytarum]URD88840.1 hypothetical protein MUK42_30145 [Musa troglodytarum]URD88841.1 hypothetical protein MUK42_30145 [Musa troglodytarum]URD88842.1 hypothetical protein MUK42_30145 [Musa troglodytarum]URD88844.1 hypothetical protein MUK42_30145 [Musa troglodytarum]
MFMALRMELPREQGNAEFKGFVDNIDFAIETEQSMVMNESSAVSTTQVIASHSTVPVLDQSCKASTSDFTLYGDHLYVYF